MIGLGSNRLSVCRRGGMSVTQAGRGGMEWLAGNGLRERTPYSAQATAALKYAYPDLWNTLMQFGFDNPDKVPFINQYPLVAPYLLADGLAFMVDCQYECSAALWKDIVGVHDFTGNGSVTLQNGVPTFNGSAWYKYNGNLIFPYASSTIEIVINFQGHTNYWASMFSVGSTSGIICVSDGSTTGYSYGGSGASKPGIGAIQSNVLQRIGMNDTAKVKNGEIVSASNAPSITLAAAADTRIGCRSDGNSCLIGKIYAIRIYNRLLTEKEILANQAIDLQRWQTS